MLLDSNRVKDLFLNAIDKPVAERSAFLNDACQGNAELRRRVEELLAEHEKSGEFPAFLALGDDATERHTPAPDAITATFAESLPHSNDQSGLEFLAPPREPGHLGRLGHYEIIEQVGAGGFGLVFKARDESLDRI